MCKALRLQKYHLNIFCYLLQKLLSSYRAFSNQVSNIYHENPFSPGQFRSKWHALNILSVFHILCLGQGSRARINFFEFSHMQSKVARSRGHIFYLTRHAVKNLIYSVRSQTEVTPKRRLDAASPAAVYQEIDSLMIQEYLGINADAYRQ